MQSTNKIKRRKSRESGKIIRLLYQRKDTKIIGTKEVRCKTETKRQPWTKNVSFQSTNKKINGSSEDDLPLVYLQHPIVRFNQNEHVETFETSL